jgi:chloride channel 7
MLGGITRITISLTVMLIEATGSVTYSLPITLAVIFAKWVGDLFNDGIYDMQIESRHLPLLPWHPPAALKYTLTAKDIMNRSVVCLYGNNRVAEVLNILHISRHSAFPVVELCVGGARACRATVC